MKLKEIKADGRARGWRNKLSTLVMDVNIIKELMKMARLNT